jgi:hypothetical protein
VEEWVGAMAAAMAAAATVAAAKGAEEWVAVGGGVVGMAVEVGRARGWRWAAGAAVRAAGGTWSQAN